MQTRETLLEAWPMIALATALLMAMAGARGLASAPPATQEWQATQSPQTWSITAAEALPSTVTATLGLADAGKPLQIVLLAGPQSTPVLRLTITRDQHGESLRTQAFTHGEGWQAQGDAEVLKFWPPQGNKVAQKHVTEDGIEPRSWRGRPLLLRVQVQAQSARVWLENHLVAQADLALQAPLVLAFTASEGDRVSARSAQPMAGGWRYLPVDLTPIANAALSQPLPTGALQIDDVPFELAARGQRWVDLEPACWVDWRRDPAAFFAEYDKGVYFHADPRMPMLQLPRCDYIAAHVLAVAQDDPSRGNRLTLRIGRYSPAHMQQIAQFDFGADVPRAADKIKPALTTAAGPLFAVRLPIHDLFAQDILDDVLDVELTKEIRLARRSPDPNRFVWRPLGLTSGVRIAAITFERSPLQMRLSSPESGHLFVEPQTPMFNVSLSNISDRAEPFRLTLTAVHADGESIVGTAEGQVEPGKTAEVSIALSGALRGYHDLTATLHRGDGQLLLRRQTSFAVLPDKQRPHREQSPFGVWDFSGYHVTPKDPDFVGPIYQKLGLRYGMFGHTAEDRARFGVRQGQEFPLRSRDGAQDLILGEKGYEARRTKHPDLLPHLLIFHEDSVSGPHVTRVPDLFHDRPPYQFNDEEQKRFTSMFEMAIEAAKAMRAHDPNVKIMLGNGPLPLREEFYRHRFPADLFDAAGNEAGVFGRMPETQPPDAVANNASLWMDRQLLDHYGYSDKPVVQCYEVIYPSTNPGNLSLQTQAAYFVRHILHSMAWGVPQIRFGGLTEMSNSYLYSNWGSSGLFRRMPEVNPKPAAVAVATLTWVLDGARFERSIAMGSPSLYGLSFQAPRGRVIALWTVRGQRPLTLQLEHARSATLIDSQGAESPLEIVDSRVQVTVSPIPCFLTLDGDVKSVNPGAPSYQNPPRGETALVSKLDSLDDWQVVTQRNPELEYYNPMTPRRQGDFAFQLVPEFEGRRGVIQVQPRPLRHGKDTMPMYAELAHARGLALPGKPTELGLWVNGNSGWGRIIYELQDARGERWISIGAAAKTDNPWMADWLPADVLAQYDPGKNADWNTDDVFGVSRINFDGWRLLTVPLPGQYPGEGYHWPANSQWRCDQEGTVDYPLTLRKIIVELPEKVLHVKTFEPPPRQAVYLCELLAIQGDERQWVKTVSGDDQPAVQMHGF